MKNLCETGGDDGVVCVGQVISIYPYVPLNHGAQLALNREINPTVYPPSEFQSKLEAGHPFLRTVLKGSMVFLMGDKRELAGLAKKRLAHLKGEASPNCF